MKISDVKAYPVWIGHRNQLVVKVETDEGVFGLGESGLSGREMAVVGAIDHYREFLLGRDPRNPAHHGSGLKTHGFAPGRPPPLYGGRGGAPARAPRQGCCSGGRLAHRVNPHVPAR